MTSTFDQLNGSDAYGFDRHVAPDYAPNYAMPVPGQPAGQIWFPGSEPSPTPPPVDPGHRSRRGVVAAVVATAVLVLALAVGGVLLLTARHGSAAADAPTASDPAPDKEPTSGGTSADDTVPAGNTATPSGSGTPSSGSTGADFLNRLPVDFRYCTAATPVDAGELAEATCGTATTQPGPTSAIFSQFDTSYDMQASFARYATDLPSINGTDVVAGASGIGTWSDELGQGQIAAYYNADGAAVLAWTDESTLTAGYVFIPAGTGTELATLGTWWQQHGYYQN